MDVSNDVESAEAIQNSTCGKPEVPLAPAIGCARITGKPEVVPEIQGLRAVDTEDFQQAEGLPLLGEYRR